MMNFNEQLKLCCKKLGRKYSIIQHIKDGSNSHIYLGYKQKQNKFSKIIIKIYDMRQIQFKQNFTRKQTIRRLNCKQAEILTHINNNNILHQYQVYQNWDYQIYIQDYCNMGTLKEHILKNRIISQQEICYILKQLISGINRFHQQKIIHGNLKTQHILIRNGLYKIGDCGIYSFLRRQGDLLVCNNDYNKIENQNKDKKCTNNRIAQTHNYLIPEVVNRQNFTTKADVWSIGLILFELLFKKIPDEITDFNTLADIVYQRKIQGIEIPKHPNYSQKIIHLLKGCLIYNHEQRISWKQLCEYDLISVKIEFKVDKLAQKMSFCCNIDQNVSQNIQRNLHNQIKQLQCQMEKIYQRIGSNIQLEQLDSKQIQQIEKSTFQPQQIIYKKAKESYFECLKTEFIYNELIIPISKNCTKLYQYGERQWITFTYLLVSRCFINMSHLRVKCQKQNSYEQLVINSLKQFTNVLYHKVKDKWQKQNNKLTKIQDQKTSMVQDKFHSIWNSSKQKEKDKFLTGIQTSDFTKKQQIQYTYKLYEKKLEKDIKKLLEFNNFRFYMAYYRQINQLTEQQYEKYNSFEEIIKDFFNKNSNIKNQQKRSIFNILG